MSSVDKTKLDSLEEDFATKTYVDSTITGIQIPDVEAQINAHNTSDTAHNDIRELINSIFETKSQVQIITWEADD